MEGIASSLSGAPSTADAPERVAAGSVTSRHLWAAERESVADGAETIHQLLYVTRGHLLLTGVFRLSLVRSRYIGSVM